MTAHEEVGVWWGSLGSHGCADKLEKGLFFFRMVSSNTPFLWGLWAPGNRVLACNFM